MVFSFSIIWTMYIPALKPSIEKELEVVTIDFTIWPLTFIMLTNTSCSAFKNEIVCWFCDGFGNKTKLFFLFSKSNSFTLTALLPLAFEFI